MQSDSNLPGSTQQASINLLVAHEATSDRPIRLPDSPPVFIYADILSPLNKHVVVSKPFQSGGSNAILASLVRAMNYSNDHGDQVLVFVVTDKRATAADARHKLQQDFTRLKMSDDICLHSIDVSKAFLRDVFFAQTFYDHMIHVFFAQGDVHGLGRLVDVIDGNRMLESPTHTICVVDECDVHVRSSGTKRHKLDQTRLLEIDLFEKILPYSDVVVAISATTMAYTDRCDQHAIEYVVTQGSPDPRFYHGLDDIELLSESTVLPSSMSVANLEKEMANDPSGTVAIVKTFLQDFDSAPRAMCVDLSCINTNASYNQYEHAQRLIDMLVNKPAVLVLNGEGLRIFAPGTVVHKANAGVFVGSISEAIETIATHSHILCVSHVCGERGQSWVSSTRVPTHGIVFPGNRDTSQLGQSMARLCFTRKHLLQGRTVKVLCTWTDYEERNLVPKGIRESSRDIYRAKYLAEICESKDRMGKLGVPDEFLQSLSDAEKFFFERLLLPSSQYWPCLHATILRKLASVDDAMDTIPLTKVRAVVRQIPVWYSERREENIPKYAFTKFNPFQPPAENKESVVYKTMMQKSSQSGYWAVTPETGRPDKLVINRACHALCTKLKEFGGVKELMRKSKPIAPAAQTA